MSRGEEENELTHGWNLIFLFELHILQLFWEWSLELLFFLSLFFREDNSILLCWYDIKFLWSFGMVRPFGMSGHTVDILGW